MTRRLKRFLTGLGLCGALAMPLATLADDNGDDADADAQEETGSLRRSDRMEFDARLVRGQKATSGAVYLFQRAPRPLPPLVVLEQSYLDRIVEPVLGPDKQELKEAARD
jgi:hypothetical protein